MNSDEFRPIPTFGEIYFFTKPIPTRKQKILTTPSLMPTQKSGFPDSWLKLIDEEHSRSKNMHVPKAIHEHWIHPVFSLQSGKAKGSTQ